MRLLSIAAWYCSQRSLVVVYCLLTSAMAVLKWFVLALSVQTARASRAAVDYEAATERDKDDYHAETQSFADDCRGLAESECNGWEGCVWEKRACRSTCMDHGRSTCPGVICRWTAVASKHICIPRQESETCAAYYPLGKEKCVEHDCSWDDANHTGGAYLACLPFCDRYTAAECPEPDCEQSLGACVATVPKPLPDVQVTELRDCKKVHEPDCNSAGSCVWEKGACRSTCKNHSSSNCPGVECRWGLKRWYVLFDGECLLRKQSEACWQYHSDRQECREKDCDWVQNGYPGMSYSYCLPKCHRYSQKAECPETECQWKEEICHPKHLPEDVSCSDLNVRQCGYLLPGKCDVLELPKSRFKRFFGIRGHEVCETHSIINYYREFKKFAVHNATRAVPDLLPSCRQHETQEDCQNQVLCEWRAFRWDDHKTSEARCTVKWEADVLVQTRAVKEASNPTRRLAGAAGAAISLPVAAVMGLAGAAGVALIYGIMTVGYTLTMGVAFPPSLLFLPFAAIGMALGILFFGALAGYAVVKACGRQVFELASMSSMKWAQVKVASGNFCQKLFEGVSPLRESSVRTVSDRLIKADRQCAAKLSNNGTKLHSVSRTRERPGWMAAQDSICKDLCIDLVDTIHHNMANIMVAGGTKNVLKACAAMVIQPVESHILSCCGEACGWNKLTGFCENWFFMSSADKSLWLDECCSEIQIVEGSDRQIMCNSVATLAERKELTKEDIKETDLGLQFKLGHSPEKDDKKITGWLRSFGSKMKSAWSTLFGSKEGQTAFLQNVTPYHVPEESVASGLELKEEQSNDGRIPGFDAFDDGDDDDEDGSSCAQRLECGALTAAVQNACKVTFPL